MQIGQGMFTKERFVYRAPVSWTTLDIVTSHLHNIINFTKDYYTYITVEEGSATTLYMLYNIN